MDDYEPYEDMKNMINEELRLCKQNVQNPR